MTYGELQAELKRIILAKMADGVTTLLDANLQTRDYLLDALENTVAEVREELTGE